MNPELPYLRKTELFDGEAEVGLRGFEQVKGVCEKALGHFNHDESLVANRVNDLMQRINARSVSNMMAAWEVYWPKFKGYIEKELSEPPHDYTSPADFFNTFLPRVIKKEVSPTPDDALHAGYWIIQLIEKRCSEPNLEMIPVDRTKPVTMIIRLIDNFRHLGKEPIPDPFYDAIVEQFDSDFLGLPLMRGIDLMGGSEVGQGRESFGMLSLALGDIFDGARHKVDAFNGSHSLDDTSALILLISDDLLSAFNEPEPNAEVIAKLSQRLTNVEDNFVRLMRGTPEIGTKSLDPLRSKAGGEKTPWHVPLVQELINQTEPGLSWDLIFRRLGAMGRDVPLPEIESINCVDDKLVIIPSDKGRKPVQISRRTLGAPTYRKPMS